MMEVSPTNKTNMNTNLLYSFLPGYWNRWFCLKLNALMLMHMDMVGNTHQDSETEAYHWTKHNQWMVRYKLQDGMKCFWVGETYDFQNTLLSKMVCIVWYETKLIMYLFWFKTSIILSYFSQKWQTRNKKVSQKERETKKACLKQKVFCLKQKVSLSWSNDLVLNQNSRNNSSKSCRRIKLVCRRVWLNNTVPLWTWYPWLNMECK